jgi:FMN phosphatase YigB (HAD superfamily)
VSFWMMPSWVNHWTCNKPYAEGFVKDWGVDITENFVNYPVGGMFWARPKALAPLLSQSFTYENFPAEPLPNDGSWLHALERVVGLLAEKQGYKQFFYYPPIGKFTTDKSHVFINYHKSPEGLFNDLNNFDVVSFDVFDTVLRREFTEPEYAKFKLGQQLSSLGLFSDADDFIQVRNTAEYHIRKDKDFKGDVSILEVYAKLQKTFNWADKATKQYMELEFEYDLQMVKAKDEMISTVNKLYDAGREIWFITDIYYTKQQIEIMLRKIGVAIPYRLFVSSELGLRKDAGTMWAFIKELIQKEHKSYIHVGDNVRSDAQICGDFGLTNVHILHPVDKWQAAGYLPKINISGKFDERNVLKWGKLIGNQGRYPFFSE